MKLSKVIGSTAILGILCIMVRKNKFSGSVNELVDKGVDIINNEKSFGGISQTDIDNLVKEIPRGVRATIKGDTLEYWYKSASGKMQASAEIIINSQKELKVYLGNGSYFNSNSPRFFLEALKKIIEEKDY